MTAYRRVAILRRLTYPNVWIGTFAISCEVLGELSQQGFVIYLLAFTLRFTVRLLWQSDRRVRLSSRHFRPDLLPGALGSCCLTTELAMPAQLNAVGAS